MEPKKPFYEVVAEKLIEQLKAGTAPWQKPWESGEPNTLLPMNPTTGKRYKGVNAIHLMTQGRSDARWMTYKQAAAVGAQVRKGEKGTPVQYWKFREEQDKLDDSGRPVLDENGRPVKETVMLERPRVFFATVFNGEQIDGLPPLQPSREQTWNAVPRAEHILKASGATITHAAGDRAFYRPSTDSITLPERGQFPGADRYYATALHELGHWTGHASRLDRDLAHPFGSEGYAKEELRAEIAAMMIGDELGVGHDPSRHAAYVGSWIKALQDDPLEVFRAAADAEKIYGYVLAFEQKQVDEVAFVAGVRSDGQAETPARVHEEHVRRHLGVPEENILAAKEARKTAEASAMLKRTDAPEAERPERERQYINVPYKEKDEAKGLGARWDRQQQSWYVPKGVEAAPFAKWAHGAATAAEAPGEAQNPAQQARQSRLYLAVPYEQRHAAKAAGALWDKAAKSWYIGPHADVAKLERWNPENMQALQGAAMTPREEFADAMRSAGLFTGSNAHGDHPIMDGKRHRVPVDGGKHGAFDGFYVAHSDGHPAGRIINHKTGTDVTWRSKGYVLSDSEKAKLRAEAAEKLAQRAALQENAQEAAAQRVCRQMVDLVPIGQPTPYLQAKGVRAHVGVMTDREGQTTYIPAFDAEGKQWTMQYIQEDGAKRFAKDSKKEGCFHPVGGMDALAAAPALVISEGYATAAQAAEAVGHATVAAFDSGNLEAVAKALHAKFPDKPVIIAGDDDRHLVMTHGHNPGREKAEAAARATGGKAIFPIFAPAENTYPRDLPAITPDSFKTHIFAEQRLAYAAAGKAEISDDEAAKLKASMLSGAHIAALSAMKRYTDFNDLAHKSESGALGVKRQIGAAISQEQKRHKKQQQQQIGLRQRRAVRISPP